MRNFKIKESETSKTIKLIEHENSRPLNNLYLETIDTRLFLLNLQLIDVIGKLDYWNIRLENVKT